PAVRQWDSSVGRLLELLQDETQWLLEQLRHKFRLEGRPEDSAGTQHAQHIRGEHGAIMRSCHLISRRLVFHHNHRRLALVTVHKVDEFCDPTLRYTTHREEQWQAQPARATEDTGQA